VNLDEPDYIVMRPGFGLPEGFMPPDMDGRWYDRATFPMAPAREEDEPPPPPHLKPAGPPAVAVPTGRFEVRTDGAVAEVWELQV
jgi:hypothetical protein